MSPVAGEVRTGAAALEVDRVSRSFGAVNANRDISFAVAPGELFGLLGPNGAGKTTLLRQLAGLLAPDSGTVRLFGRALDPRGMARALAYLPQEDAALAELPVGLAVETTARLRGFSPAAARDERAALLGELGLERLARRPLVRLSGGERRLAALAAALAGGRPLLLLDEPTTGLDPLARRAVWAAVQRRRTQGATVVLVTHNVLEAETVLERVAVLDRGRLIACGTPGELKAGVSHDLRLELVWRAEPPADPLLIALRTRAECSGRRWTLRLPAGEARRLLGELTTGPALAALDDFTLATPSLEDVYLALGGRAGDLERE